MHRDRVRNRFHRARCASLPWHAMWWSDRHDADEINDISDRPHESDAAADASAEPLAGTEPRAAPESELEPDRGPQI